MEGDHTIHALRRKRAEVLGAVFEAEEALNQRRIDLVHIDAVLRMFGPEAEPGDIKPCRTYNRNGYFAPEKLDRLLLDTARQRSPSRRPTSATPSWTPRTTTESRRLVRGRKAARAIHPVGTPVGPEIGHAAGENFLCTSSK